MSAERAPLLALSAVLMFMVLLFVGCSIVGELEDRRIERAIADGMNPVLAACLYRLRDSRSAECDEAALESLRRGSPP